MSGTEFLGALLQSQVLAPVLFIDWPSTKNFSITNVFEKPRGVSNERWGRLYEPREFPDLLVINGKVEGGGNFKLEIDIHEKVFFLNSLSNIDDTMYAGSAWIALALLGLPSLLATFPVILAAHCGYAVQRATTGMDRHLWAIWRKLKKQLPADRVELVKQAFVNHFNGVEEKYYDRIRSQYEEKLREYVQKNLFNNRKNDPVNGSFMVRLKAGNAKPEDVVEEILNWRRRESHDYGVQIHEWLGMSREEYNVWKCGDKTVVQILNDRKNHEEV